MNQITTLTSYMKRQFTFAGLAAMALTFGKLQATPVQIDLGPPGALSFDSTVPVDAFNGMPLLGQVFSVDFIFTHDEFVRLFSVTKTYETSLLLQTDGSGLVGFMEGTGYLMDHQNHALQTPQELGSAASSTAWMAVGLFPLWSAEVLAPFDHFGVHYDLSLPMNPSVHVTGGHFRLYSYGADGPFGVGPGLPADIVSEGGSTLLLLGVSLTGLAGLTIRKRTITRRRQQPNRTEGQNGLGKGRANN